MKKRAFTLIELLILLVIIGVVATLAVPEYQKWVIWARGAEAMRNLQALADSTWRYHTETGYFPPNEVSSEILPAVLDVKVDNPSKYFFYTYDSEPYSCQIMAYHIDISSIPYDGVPVV